MWAWRGACGTGAGVALAALAGFVLPAHAQRGYGYPYGDGYAATDGTTGTRRARSTPPRKFRPTPSRRETVESQPQKDAGFGDMPKGPLQLVVSIDHQKVTLFSNGVPVAQGPVSTGVPGHPTPTGVFSIIEKDRYHHSNLYSDAPMPFMQRITWSGVALHEGVLPGYPASHGCIRMSHDFARKLWPVTKLGVRVVVARGDLAPVAFAHPKLFVPKPKPPEPAVAMNPSTNGLARPALHRGGTADDAGCGAATRPQRTFNGRQARARHQRGTPKLTKTAVDFGRGEATRSRAEASRRRNCRRPRPDDVRTSAVSRDAAIREPASTPAVTAEPKAIESRRPP